VGHLVYHSILLASEDWCKQAAAGKAKVYSFLKGRRKRIKALAPGSVCIVLTKKTHIVYGEFTVKEVKRVASREYRSLVEKGLIIEPQELQPREKVWVLFFDEFVEYPVKVRKEELVKVYTSTSRKPISEWPILGQTYIDDKALRAIRRIARGIQPHLEQAISFLEEGRRIVKENPVQASEKLYRAVEEAVKALTISLNLEEILRKVRERGEWGINELEKAALKISEKLGDWFTVAWDRALVLYTLGHREAKLDSEDVEKRLPDIEKLVEKIQEYC
jgi:hypothetical protein